MRIIMIEIDDFRSREIRQRILYSIGLPQFEQGVLNNLTDTCAIQHLTFAKFLIESSLKRGPGPPAARPAGTLEATATHWLCYLYYLCFPLLSSIHAAVC